MRAIVTGAASGIGRACARGMAADGDRVLAVDLDEEALREAHRGGGPAPAFRVCDVARAYQCAAAVGAALERFGGLDALIHCAAVHSTRTWEEATAEEFNRVLEINVTGSFLMAQAAARPMAAAGKGAIVLAASSIVYSGGVGGTGRGGPAYASSKAAVVALTRSLARALGPSGVRVAAIAPGSTETPMTANYTEEDWRAVSARSALGRPGTVEDVADAARFLVSDRARYVTGEVLNVNGGAAFA